MGNDNRPNHEYIWDDSTKTSDQTTDNKPTVFVPNYLRIEGVEETTKTNNFIISENDTSKQNVKALTDAADAIWSKNEKHIKLMLEAIIKDKAEYATPPWIKK